MQLTLSTVLNGTACLMKPGNIIFPVRLAGIESLFVSIPMYTWLLPPIFHLCNFCELARLFLLVAAQFKLCNAGRCKITFGHC